MSSVSSSFRRRPFEEKKKKKLSHRGKVGQESLSAYSNRQASDAPDCQQGAHIDPGS